MAHEDNGDQGVPTPRICEACDGAAGDCKWCCDGYQSPAQQTSWRVFRNRMRKISSTYSLLEDLVSQVIGRLEKVRTDRAIEMVEDGRRLLAAWRAAEADTEERKLIVVRMSAFHRKALDMLTGV